MWAAIISLIMQAAAAYSQNRAQKAVIAERNRRMQNESERQEQYGKQATQLNEETQDKFKRENQEQSLADAFQSRAQSLRKSTDDGSYVGSSAGSQPSVVSDEISRMVANAAKFSGKQNDALARFGSYGQVGMDNQIGLLETSRDLGGIQESSRRSSDILPLELAAAVRAGDRWRQISDLMRMGSQAMSMSGMTGGGGAGGATAASGAAGAVNPSGAYMGSNTGFQIPRLTY